MLKRAQRLSQLGQPDSPVFVYILYKKAYLYVKFILFYFQLWIGRHFEQKENRPEFTPVNIREEEEV